MVYAMILAAVRKAAGQFNVQLGSRNEENPPENQAFQQILQSFNQQKFSDDDLTIKQYKEKTQYNPNKNEFAQKVEIPHWRELYQSLPMTDVVQKIISSDASFSNKSFLQLHQRYIIAEHESGLLLIDQKAAHERILYEKLKKKKNGKKNSQQLLYPLMLELNIQDRLLFEGQMDFLKELGFMLHISENKVFIHGVPSEIRTQVVESMLTDLVHELGENPSFQMDVETHILQLLAKQAAIPSPKILTQSEMESIVTQLFVCDSPSFTPKGKPTFVLIDLEEIGNRFR
jgi:DNA mismatch repair ATPase MutL